MARTASNGQGVLIEPTSYGAFFIRDENFRVWDGKAWRGFGEAERYASYPEAFRARRSAVAARQAA